MNPASTGFCLLRFGTRLGNYGGLDIVQSYAIDLVISNGKLETDLSFAWFRKKKNSTQENTNQLFTLAFSQLTRQTREWNSNRKN